MTPEREKVLRQLWALHVQTATAYALLIRENQNHVLMRDAVKRAHRIAFEHAEISCVMFREACTREGLDPL